MLESFKGMFAFVLLDETLEKAFLVRDSVGRKPLYLSQNERSLLPAQKLKD